MPLRLVDSPNEYPNTHDSSNSNNTLHHGQADTASLDAIQQSRYPDNNNTATTSTSTGAERTDAINPGSAPSPRRMTKEEADRLYEENIEEEYAKREGGA